MNDLHRLGEFFTPSQRKTNSNQSSKNLITSMIRIKTNPKYTHLEPYLRQLILSGQFNNGGEVLYDKRNTVKLFTENGMQFVVKRFGRPSFFNLLVYSAHIRKSKAERAFRHATRLRQLEIDTPEEIAFIEIRKRGILEVCYFVSAYSDYCPLSPITENFTQESGKRPILDMLSGFLYTMHSVGVHHKDLHIGNILYKENGSGGYDFQIIDTNRMKFGVFLTQRQRLINLQRLSCPASAYLYILEQYARIAHIDPEYLQLKGAFTRLIYEFRRYYRHKLKNQCRKILHK